MSDLIASHIMGIALAADESAAPEWVQITPAGPDLPTRDGRRFSLRNPDAVIAASMASVVDLMIDVEHASETRPAQGLAAPAVGWIKELEARAGAIWGRVEWTAQAREWITSKAYRYLSPTFYHSKDGDMLRLKSAALVNNPAFEMTALASVQHPQMEKDTMDKSVLDALGLAATASAADVVTAIVALKGDVQTAIARADNPDPAQFIARAQYDATAEKLAEATATIEAQAAAQFDAAVDAGIEAGKITPAARDNYLAMASAIGLEAFSKQVEGMPRIVGAADTEEGEAAASAGLTPEDRLVAGAFDMSETDFAAAKK